MFPPSGGDLLKRLAINYKERAQRVMSGIQFEVFRMGICKECGVEFVRGLRKRTLCGNCNAAKCASPLVSIDEKQRDLIEAIRKYYTRKNVFTCEDIKKDCNPREHSLETCRSYMRDMVKSGWLIVVSEHGHKKGEVMKYKIA